MTAALATALAAALASTPAQAADHSHVAITATVPTDAAGSPGDILGLYAIELLPCPNAPAAALRPAALLQGVLALLINPAQANHRERFDGPAAKEILRRVPLDRAQTMALGELVAPAATYCEVRLTLARLPAVAATAPGSAPLAALPVSLRLARPGTLAPFRIDYSQPFTIKLARPSTATGCAATLAIVLRPAALRPLLADKTLDFGELSQRVLTGMAEHAGATLACR